MSPHKRLLNEVLIPLESMVGLEMKRNHLVADGEEDLHGLTVVSTLVSWFVSIDTDYADAIATSYFKQVD